MRLISNALVVLALKAGAPPLQFLLLIVTARWFGVAVRGEIALFSAAVNLFVLIVGFTGGASIAYLTARDPSRAFLRKLIAVSYIFCVVVPIALGLLAALLGQPVLREAPLVVWVAIMNAMLVVNIWILMSGHAVWQVSLLEFLRPFCLVALTVMFASVRGFHSPTEFYLIWCAAATLAVLLSLPLVVARYRRLPPDGAGPHAPVRDVARDLLRLGFLVQASNLIQFLNYRSLYFALERHAGIAAVGLFSTAVALAEVLWIPANSLAVLTLNRVTRSSTAPEIRPFVLQMARLALTATLVVAVLAALVPAGWITALLGRDFAAVRGQLVSLLPGVVAMGMAVIASAYYAGNGLYQRNLFAALAGFLPTLVGIFALVPNLRASGAIVAMNVSYLLTSIFLLVSLARRERASLGEFVPRIGDVARAMAVTR